MIKLFVTDLDGCISIPFETPSWNHITEIRKLNQQSSDNPAIPPLSICSGRPYPYVEAVAQWLDVQLPVVFESGGMYNFKKNKFSQNGFFDEEKVGQIGELKQWMREEIISRFPDGILEFSKAMDAGFVHHDSEIIERVLPLVQDHVANGYSGFEVHHTDISINVILSKNNKKTGILNLCKHIDITPEEVAYIGDSVGDIPALEIVGQSFAPANAQDKVKEMVKHSLNERATASVLEAYQRIIAFNK